MASKEPTVLAIDDNQDNLITLQAVLREALPQITLLTASNGRQGLKLAAAEDPNVILLDIVMPGMDAFTVCRKLKSSESLQAIPVIFLTALRTDRKSRIEALEAGAEGFLIKPLDEIDLVAQIQAMIKIKAANRLQRMEKEALATLVSERTRKLKKELTERVKTEQALQKSEEKFRGLYQSIRDAILVADTDRNIIDCNPAFTALFGYAHAEILGQKTLVVYENKAGFARLGKSLQAHDGNQLFRKTVNYKKKTGEIFPGETSVFYLKDDQGQVTGFIGLIRDITERQQAQQLLLESEEKFRRTFYTSPDSVNINRLDDGMYISINPGFTQITGYSEADVIGKTSLEINIWGNPEDRNTLVAGLKKSGTVQNLEAKFRRKDGHCVHGLMSAAIIDLQGVPHILSITRDINERKQNEQALRESEERFRSLYENVTLGLYRTTPDGRILLANPSLVHLLGYSSAEELRHLNLNQEGFQGGYSRSEFMARIEREEQIVGLESTWKHRDGRVIHFRESARVSRDQEGRVQYYEGTVEDITDLKRATKALQESEEKFRKAFYTSPDSININRLEDGVFVSINPGFTQITGYSETEVIGKTSLEINIWDNPKDRNTFATALKKCGVVQNHEAKFHSKDGRTGYGLMSAAVIDLDGVPHMINITRDITERKRAEQRYRELFEDAPVMYVLTRYVKGTPVITDCNQLFWHTLGYGHDELVGQSLTDLYTPASRAEILEHNGYRRAMHGTFTVEERELQTRGGQIISCVLQAVPEVDATGQIVGTRAMFMDITERKQLSMDLASERDELNKEIMEHEEAEKARQTLIGVLENKAAEMERFVYTVSHDLKSPLITVQGFLGLLEKDALEGETKRLQDDIRHIKTAAKQMQQLLEDLLEISRIGRVVNTPEPVSFHELAEDAVVLLAGQIQACDAQIDIAADLPILFGDRKRLLEVVQNLIDNALKFRNVLLPPHIEIGCRREKDQNICYIRDNGIGIEPRYQDKVFELFERLNPAVEGTGIGLAIIKRIIDLEGGRIWVESAGEGSGCSFCFVHPEQDKHGSSP